MRVLPIAAALLLAACLPAHAGSVLARIAARGQLACGVLSAPPDYTLDDTHGALPAFGTDICRAVAAALLGDAQSVRLLALPDQAHGFAAVKAGRVDLLLGATPLLSAGPLFGLAFGRPVFFDGLSVLAERREAIARPQDLAGKAVCYIAGRQTEPDLEATLGARHVAWRPDPFEEMGEMEAALVTRHCDAMAGDVSELADARARFKGRAADFAIMPGLLTLDPMVPAWSAADVAFGRVVDRVTSALLAAEAAGLTQAAAAAAAAAALHGAAVPAWDAVRPEDRAAAQLLGLRPDWMLRAVASVGNEAELFRRDLGDGSPLRLARGENALWTDGGLLYPLPAR